MRVHNSTDIPAKIRHVFALSCCKEMCRVLDGIEFLFYKGPVHAEELYTDPWVRAPVHLQLDSQFLALDFRP